MFNLDQFLDPTFYYIRIPVVLLSLTVHEWAHAFMAFRYGDTTAKQLGRLSLNPIKHLDPIGSIMLLLYGFGWAKPVPINPNNFSSRKSGEIMVSIAGPLSNIILAFIVLTYWILYPESKGDLNIFLRTLVSLNLGLAVLNLLPIPPLDGSHIILPFLPYRAYVWFVNYQNYVFGVMILLLFTGVLSPVISFFIDLLFRGMYFVINLILGRGFVWIP